MGSPKKQKQLGRRKQACQAANDALEKGGGSLTLALFSENSARRPMLMQAATWGRLAFGSAAMACTRQKGMRQGNVMLDSKTD